MKWHLKTVPWVKLTKWHPHLVARAICNEYYRVPISFAHLFAAFLSQDWLINQSVIGDKGAASMTALDIWGIQREFNSLPPGKSWRDFKKDKPCLIDTFRSFYENALRSMARGPTDNHYNNIIINAMVSQITSISIVYLTISSGHIKENIKVSVTGLFVGNSPVTGKFHA